MTTEIDTFPTAPANAHPVLRTLVWTASSLGVAYCELDDLTPVVEGLPEAPDATADGDSIMRACIAMTRTFIEHTRHLTPEQVKATDLLVIRDDIYDIDRRIADKVLALCDAYQNDPTPENVAAIAALAPAYDDFEGLPLAAVNALEAQLQMTAVYVRDGDLTTALDFLMEILSIGSDAVPPSVLLTAARDALHQ